ncbi:MAG: hypothetical protein RL367_2055 [Pseudomonadota bacterium]
MGIDRDVPKPDRFRATVPRFLSVAPALFRLRNRALIQGHFPLLRL